MGSDTEHQNQQILEVSSDRPLTDPSDDRFDHAPFAEHLAKSIVSLDASKGLVIGLFGGWGTGKSTLIEFLVHNLFQIPEEGRPIIIRFNPWLFSGQEDLVRQFFTQLQNCLKQKWHGTRKFLGELGEFATAVSGAPLPGASAGIWLGKLLSLFSKPRGIDELKKEIEKGLLAHGRKILVLIDDVDRLSNDEIREVFRLVKSVADFPNIIYLLAFDREVVERAIETIQQSSGRAYLEKIVQVPFDLPIPDKEALRAFCLERLSKLVGEIPDHVADQSYIGNVYMDGIDPFISKPRDVIRLINSANLTYPPVKNEVNPLDFIALEALRIFQPVVYELIRTNPGKFSGTLSSSYGIQHERESEKKFHDTWLGQVSPDFQHVMKRFMYRLFPRLEAIWGNTHYGDYDWKTQMRVCSPDVMPVYFRLSTPKNSISNSEMQTYLKLAEDSIALERLLIEFSQQKFPDGKTRARVFLERLEDHTSKVIPLSTIPSYLRALLKAGDRIVENEGDRQKFFDFGVGIHISRVIRQLLLRIDQGDRFRIFEPAARAGALGSTIDEIVTFGRQHGRLGPNNKELERNPLFPIEDIETLEKIALEKIKLAAEDGSLIENPRIFLILWTWKELKSEEVVKEWLTRAIASDPNLIRLLERALSFTLVQSSGSYVTRRIPRLNPKNFQPFLDPNALENRVRSLSSSSSLSDRERLAMEQFLKELEAIKNGKNPDSMDWG